MSDIKEEVLSSVATIDVPIEETKVHDGVQVEERVHIRVKGGKVYAFFKRAFDIFASLIAIIVLAIPMLIVGIIVKCSSKGPMIYVSERVGKNGKKFKFYKFRSMIDKADEYLN